MASLLNPLLAVAFNIGPFPVRWYGVIICCGMLIAMIIAYSEVRRQQLSVDDLVNMLLIIIPCGILGSRIFYVVFNWDYYGQNPQYILAIWRGGLAIQGGIILCIIGLIIYCRKKKQSFFQWADVFVPVLSLAQGIGRWGNYINAEAYGPVIESGSFWSWMPFQIYVDGSYHHPIFLYESIWDIAVFVLLFVTLRKKHRIGTPFALYLILYSVARLLIDQIRVDALLLAGEVRVAIVTAILLILAGAAILWKIRKQPKVLLPLTSEEKPKSKQKKKKKS